MPSPEGTTVLSRRTVWGLAFTAVALRFLAQPPLDLGLAIWLAPIPWLFIASLPAAPKRAGYVALWTTGFLFWLATMQGVRLAHPAQYLGWFVLSAYLGCYTPLFVGLTRVAHRQLRWPLAISAALVWMGLELIRSYAFTGFSAVMLGHALLDWPLLFQIADVSGTYLVSGLIIVAAAALLRLGQRLFAVPSSGRWIDVSVAGLAMVAATLYGAWRLNQAEQLAAQPPLLKIATVQRDTAAVYEFNREREESSVRNYLAGSIEVLREAEEVDLLVWPESMFTVGALLYLDPKDDVVPPEVQMSPSEFRQIIRQRQEMFASQVAYVQRQSSGEAGRESIPAFLFGVGAIGAQEGRLHSYNAAVLFDDKHHFRGWYGKRHLVMFGEYLPFGTTLPWLYTVLPMPQGTTPGPEPRIFEVDGIELQPSICFETMVEQVTGDALRTVRQRGHNPQLLVNITNDGWFHGTAILDHHLDCTRAVAVANRRPVVVAANSGITAWIDGSGRLIAQLPKRVEATMLAEPTADGRASLYQRAGDWPIRTAALLCPILAIIGWRHRASRRPPR